MPWAFKKPNQMAEFLVGKEKESCQATSPSRKRKHVQENEDTELALLASTFWKFINFLIPIYLDPNMYV